MYDDIFILYTIYAIDFSTYNLLFNKKIFFKFSAIKCNGDTSIPKTPNYYNYYIINIINDYEL